VEESTVQAGPRSPLANAHDLGAGFIGAGFVGRVHAHAARLAGARIAGVAASVPDRAGSARDELGAEQGFATAEELIRSDEVDVVHVCTPNNLHVPLAMAAVEAGKHVICEKPIALGSAEAERLTAAAEAAGVLVTVPFVYRYYPIVRELRTRLAAGVVPARLITGGYLQDWLVDGEDWNWRVDPELGGASRAFADIGSHWCDLVEFVSGQRITSLVARTAIAHENRRAADAPSFERAEGGEVAQVRTEDLAALLFETGAGATGSLVVSQVSAGRKNRLWVEISAGSETFAFDQERPDELAVLHRDAAELIPRDAATLHPDAARYVTLPAGHPQGYQDCFDAFVAESYAAFSGEAPADGLPGLADGTRAVRLTEAVLESARRNEWVKVPR
jgi:predicted dehydrogenase